MNECQDAYDDSVSFVTYLQTVFKNTLCQYVGPN